MSLTTASASLDGLVSIEELSEALSSVNEDLKEAFSWKDVLVKLVLAAIAIAVVAIVLAVMGLGGFLAAVLIVFVAAIVMTLASFVITGAVNGWGTALGNAAENLIVVAAIGGVLVGSTAGVGTFITQSVVPAITNSAHLGYASASTFMTTKALPAITKIGPAIRKINSSKNFVDGIIKSKITSGIFRYTKSLFEVFTGFNKSLETIKLTYQLLKTHSYSYTIGMIAHEHETIKKSIGALFALGSMVYYAIEGDKKKVFRSLISFGTNAIPTTDITEEQMINEGVDNLSNSLFSDEENNKNNQFGPDAPESQISDTNPNHSLKEYPIDFSDILYPGENNQFKPDSPECQMDKTNPDQSENGLPIDLFPSENN